MNKKLATGTCRFCGQQCQVEVPEEATQQYIDDAVVKVCVCTEAKHEARKIEKLERAIEYIDNLFGFNEDKAALFRRVISDIYDKTVRKVRIQDWEWNYSIFIDGDDMIHIDRTKNVKEETAF